MSGHVISFDHVVDRRHSGSSKWNRYPEDVLPLWVADMDFPVASCIVTALRERLEHPLFGYAVAEERLRTRLVAEMAARYGWDVAPDAFVFLPGVEPGFNMALRAFLSPRDLVALQTPIYAPMLSAASHWGLGQVALPMQRTSDRWSTDPAILRDGLRRARAFLFCHPHNPTGTAFEGDDLATIAEACLSAGTLIISDEIHCDLLFDARRHTPIASLSPEIGRRTITLMAASKAYNIAGLKTAFAIIPDADLRAQFNRFRLGMVDSVNALGLVATEAAYSGAESWRAALLAYLQGNRDHLVEQIARRFPQASMTRPDATFLAWIDWRGSGLVNPHEFFLERARVGLNDGATFGPGGAGFVRLNFGCPRVTLDAALDRMERSLAA